MERNDIKNAWETLRANWVNGNRSDAFEAINSAKKRDLLEIVGQAIREYRVNNETSGDLIDLAEIISYSINQLR